MLPSALRGHVAASLTAQFGENTKLISTSSLGGGCIGNATRLDCGTRSVFLKWLPIAHEYSGIFAAEAHALARLHEHVTTPAVIDVGAADDFEWIILEWLEPGSVSKSGWRDLGTQLAHMHRARSAQFGWDQDNFIGSLPQSNTLSPDWPSFWRNQRILPQLERAENRLDAAARRRMDMMLEHIDELAGVGNDDGASLLHGDLWSGNVHGLANGAAALIDPASYYGHREVDLAMARLFGGFDNSFFHAYESEWPLSADAARRCALYQLYYLLVHVNLFGASYVSGTLSTLSKIGF